MILIHHYIHRCIIISNLCINYGPYNANILQIEVFIKNHFICTLSTLIFTSLYSYSLSQYHGWNPWLCRWYSLMGSIYVVTLITMGQYHVIDPWYLEYLMHKVYATLLHQTCMYMWLGLDELTHRSSNILLWLCFFVPACIHNLALTNPQIDLQIFTFIKLLILICKPLSHHFVILCHHSITYELTCRFI